LSALREVEYAIHCRLSQFRRGRKAMEFTSWLEPEWIELLKLDASSLLIDGDLVIDGKSIAHATATQVDQAVWITQRRHSASIWLIGDYSSYTETPADT